MQSVSPDERWLVARARQRDRAAFQVLVERHAQYVYNLALRVMRQPQEAEDLAQEAFLRAYHNRGSLRDTGTLVAWLYRIVTNICLDRLRQHSRRAPLESEADPDEVELPDPDTFSPQQTIEQNEMSTCVQQYIADLPDSYRAVILLHDLQGLTGPEIAQALDVSLATVKIRLHRARNRLQAALKAGCTFSRDERDVFVCEPRP